MVESNDIKGINHSGYALMGIHSKLRTALFLGLMMSTLSAIKPTGFFLVSTYICCISNMLMFL